MDRELAETVIRLDQLYDALSFAGAKLYRTHHADQLKAAIRREIAAAEMNLDRLLAELAGETVNVTNRVK